MNLKQLHTYLGQLLDAGVDPSMSVVVLTNEWPGELDNVRIMEGGFDGDPPPQLVPLRSEGTMLLLTTVREDVGDLLSGTGEEGAMHTNIKVPVEPPHKLYGQIPDTP